MTVPVQTPYNSYTYAGSATFVYNFQILQATDLQVSVGGVVQPLANYTVSGIGNQGGGSILYTGTLTTGQLVELQRVTVLSRSNDYQDEGDFLAETVNSDYDRIWMVLQEQQRAQAQSIRVPETGGVPVLPAAAARANTFLGFDLNGALTLVAASVGSAASLALQYAGSAGSSLIGWIQAGTGMLARTVQDKLRERVDLADFAGADPSGTTDASAALQAAVNTGKAIYLGDASRNWKITSPVNYSGKVYIFGKGATIKSDILFLKVLDGSGSRLHGFNVMPVTTPWTIKRTTGGNNASWTNVLADIKNSLEGYKVGAQDLDLWPTFSGTANEITNRSINPGILFDVSSAAGGTDVRIEDIGGRQLCIIIQGYTESGIRFCTYGGGGLTYGGAVFVNGITRAYDSSFKGFTLPRGTGNFFDDNKVRYATLSGCCWFGNDDFSMQRNTSQFNGESGLKTYQYDAVAGPSETIACINTSGRIIGNKASDNYYDGIDAAALNNVAQIYVYGGTIVSGNTMERNRHTGSITNASNMVYVGNHANANGTHGLKVTDSNNTVSDNHCRNNTTTGAVLVAQPFDLVVQGDDCVVTDNNVSNATAVATFNFLHTGLLGAAPTNGHEGIDSGNYCDQGPSRIAVSSTIPSSKNGMFVSGVVRTDTYFQGPKLTNVTGAGPYAVLNTDVTLSIFSSANITLTMPDPTLASNVGRRLRVRQTAAFTVVSSAANIGPLAGGAPATTMLSGAGKWLDVEADGTAWIITAAN